MTRRILVTGANGFVGRVLTRRLAESAEFTVRAATRSGVVIPGAETQVTIGDIGPGTDWSRAVTGIDTVVHLAARVHQMRETLDDPMAEYRRVNTSGTLGLANAANAAGVRRFVFISSIKVNGEAGLFDEASPQQPVDPYGVSKAEAEAHLFEIARRGKMEVVIIRPPLVYGPGVRANFQALSRAIARGVPLPLGAIHNQRSLVAVDNLVDFIVRCIDHPRAANEVFLVSDGQDLSTTELARAMARALGRPALLLPVPAFLLKAAARGVGKRNVAQRVLGSLQLDISKARELLGWSPLITVDEGLRRALRSFR
jgi:nucleoside-diphosphate-sugar epimerase